MVVLCSTHGLQCPMPMVRSVAWACGCAAKQLLALPAGPLGSGLAQPATVDAPAPRRKRKRPHGVEAHDAPASLDDAPSWREVLVDEARPPVQCWMQASRAQLQAPLYLRARVCLTEAADVDRRQHDVLLVIDLTKAASSPARSQSGLEAEWKQATTTSTELTVTSQVRSRVMCCVCIAASLLPHDTCRARHGARSLPPHHGVWYERKCWMRVVGQAAGA